MKKIIIIVGNENYSIYLKIVLVSDRCSLGIYEDKTGPAISKIMDEWYPDSDINIKIIPDDEYQLTDLIKHYARPELGFDLILTAGGTGLSKRDITPEVTRKLIHKEAYGLSIAMLVGSLKITPLAGLSRPCCGTINESLIINLPGSPKGSTENLIVLGKKTISHAISIIKGIPFATNSVGNKGQGDMDFESSCNCGSYSDNKVKRNESGERHRKSLFPMIDENKAVTMILQEVTLMDPIHFSISKYINLNSIDSFRNIYNYETVISNMNIPSYPTSIKDGYAVNSSSNDLVRILLGASYPGKCLVVDKTSNSSAVQVSTGSVIPLGFDSVIQIEDTVVHEKTEDGKFEKSIKLNYIPTRGQDIRPIGNDIKSGQILLNDHDKINPQTFALICSLGVKELKIYKSPKIALLSTGDEIIDMSSSQSLPGCVYDSNRYMLAGLLRKFNFPFEDMGIVRDDPSAIRTMLVRALETCDVVITSGGVSMGERDYLKGIISQDLGGHIHFGRLNLKPGMPTTFATIPRKSDPGFKVPIFALPGNPVSAFVMFHVLVLPALVKMAGGPDYRHYLPSLKATLKEDLVLDPRPEYRRGILEWSNQRFEHANLADTPNDIMLPSVRTTGKNQMSSCLASTSKANCLVRCPSKTGKQNKLLDGDIVDVLYID